RLFAQPCLLLLIGEAPAHGYELMERLRGFGFDAHDPATVYKLLRHMEKEHLVASSWQVSARGPARRVYSLTSDGRDLLITWAFTLKKNRDVLGQFLDRYCSLAAVQSAGGDR